MERIRLRPTEADLLSADPHMPEMVNYVHSLISSSDHVAIAKNAALAYLALVTAFSKGGLLMKEWAPRLLIDVSSREYEIIIDGEADNQGSPVRNMTMESEMSPSVRSERVRDIRKKAPILDALLARDFSKPTEGVEANSPQSSLTCEGAANAIVIQLRDLNSLEHRAQSLSVHTNWSYWRLGISYQRYAELQLQTEVSGHPRTVQKVIFERLCVEVAASWSLDDKARTTLKKRLTRARKFVLLVDCLGSTVLNAVPEVSVTRLDVVKLEDLILMKTGSIEAGKVKQLVLKMS